MSFVANTLDESSRYGRRLSRTPLAARVLPVAPEGWLKQQVHRSPMVSPHVDLVNFDLESFIVGIPFF